MAVSRATIASRCTGCSANNGLNSLDNLLSLNTVITELMRPISIYGLDNLLSLMASAENVGSPTIVLVLWCMRAEDLVVQVARARIYNF